MLVLSDSVNYFIYTACFVFIFKRSGERLEIGFRNLALFCSNDVTFTRKRCDVLWMCGFQ